MKISDLLLNSFKRSQVGCVITKPVVTFFIEWNRDGVIQFSGIDGRGNAVEFIADPQRVEPWILIQNNIAEATANFTNFTMDCTGCGLQCPPGVTDINNCINTCKQDFTNISQNLTANASAECMQTNANLTKIINEASNEITQDSTASNTGLFGSLASLGSIGMIVVVLAGLALVAVAMFLVFFL